jgi:acyl carrier protein
MNKTETQIKKILSSSLGLEEERLHNNASFTTDLNTDPLELNEAVRKLYEEFKIEDEKTTFNTVGELVNFIKDHLDEIEE